MCECVCVTEREIEGQRGIQGGRMGRRLIDVFVASVILFSRPLRSPPPAPPPSSVSLSCGQLLHQDVLVARCLAV